MPEMLLLSLKWVVVRTFLLPLASIAAQLLTVRHMEYCITSLSKVRYYCHAGHLNVYTHYHTGRDSPHKSSSTLTWILVMTGM